MAGYRFWLQCGLSVVLASAFVRGASAQRLTEAEEIPAPRLSRTAAATSGPTCKIYSLSELGDDPKLSKWIADTIPEMIQPASWKEAGAKLSYYAPSRILVVNNTAAVHAQVDEFLQNLKKSLPPQKASAARHDTGVMPAQFTVPDSPRPFVPVQTGPSGYPVPFTAQTPKHLFHFIIRYEGEGIIDANVVKFAKALQDKMTGGNNATPAYSAPTVVSQTPMGPASGPFSAPPLTTYAPGATTPPTKMPPADAPPAPRLPPPPPSTQSN